MPIFGVDVSSFQSSIDLAAVSGEGFDFVIIKATQGSTYVNPAFAGQLAAAQSAGLIVCAYHYVDTSPVAAQVANANAHIPVGLPIIPDVENGSGDADNARAVVAGLQAAGHNVPLIYLPQWYWQQIGSPSLAGLPPLWSSKYPTTTAAPASTLYQNVPASYWSGYGGSAVVLLQFADSARVAGLTVDASAFGGSRDQLAALLGGAPAPTSTVSEEAVSHILLEPTIAPADPKSDPSTWPTREITIPIAQIGGWHGDAMIQVVLSPYYDHDPSVCGFVRWANWFVTSDIHTMAPGPVGADDAINQNGAPFSVMWPAKWGPAPHGTVSFSLMYAAPSGGCIEVERQH